MGSHSEKLKDQRIIVENETGHLGVLLFVP